MFIHILKLKFFFFFFDEMGLGAAAQPCDFSKNSFSPGAVSSWVSETGSHLSRSSEAVRVCQGPDEVRERV